jgi:hypothetical protein
MLLPPSYTWSVLTWMNRGRLLLLLLPPPLLLLVAPLTLALAPSLAPKFAPAPPC